MKPPASLIWQDDKAVLVKKAKRKPGCCDVQRCRGTLGPSAVAKGNKTCSKCLMRRWRANNKLPGILADLRQRASRRGFAFDLTMEYMLTLDGIEEYIAKRGTATDSLHLDRKETSLGYVQGNVRVMLAGLNIAKGNRERHYCKETEKLPF